MASIHSMEIRGIRCFESSESEDQRITFISPVTCIVGQNGCGKTTIIECLRYATTGQAPPGTDKGKSFVYDPKLTAAGESLGQVKLRFTSTKKQIMQIKRSLKCTLQGRSGKMEMKTLETTFEYKDKHGQTHAVGGRCMDINNCVFDNLGVSQAILENVIFCHQEDSNWPLDESKKLKEKFDDIFDAKKYNDASDNIRKMINKRAEGLKICKTGLALYKEYWDVAKKKQSELSREKGRLQEGVERLQTLNEEKSPKEKELTSIIKREDQFSKLTSKISNLESSKENLISEQDRLRKNINSLHKGSKIKLEEEIKNFELNVKTKEREILDLDEKITKLNNEDRNLSSRIQKEQIELGRLTQEEKSYQETLKKRFEFLKNISIELEIEFSVESPQNKQGTDKAFSSLEKAFLDLETDAKNTVREQDQVEKALEDEIYKCRDAFSKAKDTVELIKSQLDETKKSLKGNAEEVKRVEAGLTRMTVLENRLSRITMELQAEEDTMNVQQSQKEISETQAERKDLEDESEVVAKEINTLQLAKGYLAEAEVYKKSIDEKKAAVHALIAKNKKHLSEIFSEIPEEKLKDAVDDVIRRNEREKVKLQKALQDAKSNQASNFSELKHLNSILKEAEGQLQAEISKIKSECGDRELDSVLRETEAELQKSQDLKGELHSSSVLFKRYSTQLSQKDPCCPLCHRDFDSRKASLDLAAELNLKISDHPAQIKECTEKHEKLQKKSSRLQQLIPSLKKIEHLQSNEIPLHRENVSELEMSLQVSETEEKSAIERLVVPENNLKFADLVKSDMAIVDKYQEEIASLEKQLDQVESKLPATGASRTLEDAQAQHDQIRAEIQKLQKAAEAKQAALNSHQIKLNDMKDKKNSIHADLLEIKSGEQKKTQLLELVKLLGEKEKQLSSELDEAKKQVVPKGKLLTAAEEQKSRAKAEHNELREKQQKRLTNVKSRLNNLKDLNKSVENFESRNLARKLEELKATVERLGSEKDDVVTQKEQTSGKTARLQKELVSQNVKKRDLDDNMHLLELGEQVERLQVELQELKEKVGDLNFVELSERKKKLNSRILDIMNEVSRLKGTQDEVQKKIKELETDLSKDKMKNAETKYRQEFVKSLVEERIVKDLQIYYLALNQSVINFHRERMEEVNRIIRELWVSIYKGSDIDYIEIKTESEDKQTATLRRTFNYRVVMVKQERELDMRGRCSAGQKMLASLVIRIALAETFSASCGILALDEPTTNLDSNNIASLGDSLIELAQSHRKQSNFQLLIITHDEEFIERMTQEQLIDSFYRVSRDINGHSKIKKYRVDDATAQQNNN